MQQNITVFVEERTIRDSTCLPLSQFYDYWLIWFQHCALASLQRLLLSRQTELTDELRTIN